jgi:hypothetical protein
VTDVTPRSAVTVPWNGGPASCRSAPTDTLISIVAQAKKHTRMRSRAPTEMPISTS